MSLILAAPNDRRPRNIQRKVTVPMTRSIILAAAILATLASPAVTQGVTRAQHCALIRQTAVDMTSRAEGAIRLAVTSAQLDISIARARGSAPRAFITPSTETAMDDAVRAVLAARFARERLDNDARCHSDQAEVARLAGRMEDAMRSLSETFAVLRGAPNEASAPQPGAATSAPVPIR